MRGFDQGLVALNHLYTIRPNQPLQGRLPGFDTAGRRVQFEILNAESMFAISEVTEPAGELIEFDQQSGEFTFVPAQDFYNMLLPIYYRVVTDEVYSTPASVQIQVIPPPNTILVTAPAEVTDGSAAKFEFASDDPEALFECRLDSEPYSPCSQITWVNNLANGRHILAARAYDPIGNRDPFPIVHIWHVNPVPETNIDFIASTFAGVSSNFVFDSNDPGAKFECKVDNNPWRSCVSPFQQNFNQGNHTFLVKAKNAVGIYDPTPAVYTWYNNFTPQTFIDSAPTAITNVTTAVLKLRTNHTSSGFRCTIQRMNSSGDYVNYRTDLYTPGASCGFTVTYSSLPLGKYLFSAYAVATRDGFYDSTPATAKWEIVGIPGKPNEVINSPEAAAIAPAIQDTMVRLNRDFCYAFDRYAGTYNHPNATPRCTSPVSGPVCTITSNCLSMDYQSYVNWICTAIDTGDQYPFCDLLHLLAAANGLKLLEFFRDIVNAFGGILASLFAPDPPFIEESPLFGGAAMVLKVTVRSGATAVSLILDDTDVGNDAYTCKIDPVASTNQVRNCDPNLDPQGLGLLNADTELVLRNGLNGTVANTIAHNLINNGALEEFTLLLPMWVVGENRIRVKTDAQLSTWFQVPVSEADVLAAGSGFQSDQVTLKVAGIPITVAECLSQAVYAFCVDA